ncbi:uncharacterized protein CIMG_13113 [Coccidioides immitis RS]|uniref:Uncharacterized protein n=2 Tax=Coccidioides immitis TaxID=5501 RepID=A0A0E1RW95_COCIM|nr:uncharacterized protein CIMG_13113 [Coccidioides immitis RS]EAS31675.1 hypothetical protein CIMG_13113 [Coccidioides immitis RS]KMU73469.1 hypothetical protein CISG_03604 [Coccidioides immitis RMSCC 3703]
MSHLFTHSFAKLPPCFLLHNLHDFGRYQYSGHWLIKADLNCPCGLSPISDQRERAYATISSVPIFCNMGGLVFLFIGKPEMIFGLGMKQVIACTGFDFGPFGGR